MQRWLAWLHLWIGIAIAIPMMLMGVTGSILVYGDDLDRLFGTAPHAIAQGEPRSPQAILAAAQAVEPKGLQANRLTMPQLAGDPAIIRLAGTNKSDARQIFLDPVSLQVLAIRGTQDGWLRFIHNLHANLLLEGRLGRASIGWIGVGLLTMALTGIYLWWPRNGKWLQSITIKRGARGFRLNRDLHNLLGVWWLPWLLLMTASGLSMCFPETIGNAVRTVLPGRDLREMASATKVPVPPGAGAIGLDQAISSARPVVGDRILTIAYVPMKPDQPWRLIFARPGDSRDLPAMTVLVDPYSGLPVDRQDPAVYTTGERLLVWLKPLHFGVAAGPIYQAAIFLTGLALPIFGITGTTMWWLKRRARRRAKAQTHTAAAASRVSQSMKTELAAVTESGRNNEAT